VSPDRDRRAFVLRHTKLRPVPGLDATRLHLTDDVLALWAAVQRETGEADAPLPYWAFAWGGGLAIARYLGERPEAVAARRVFDLGSGSGVCAIVALGAGASAVVAADIDPFAAAAIELNARANRRRLTVVNGDVLDEPPPSGIDVILAGDCWYEQGLAGRSMRWLRQAHEADIEVLVGDPGRRYLPTDELEPLATYEVRTTTELEDLDLKRATVYRLRG
jgi:predicted nicotinamide N-methyase